MREKMMDYQNETNHLYNLEATPAEGTSRRLAKIDKDKYPDIIVANNEAAKKRKATPYYTNSSQLPVNYTEDLFEALDLQTIFKQDIPAVPFFTLIWARQCRRRKRFEKWLKKYPIIILCLILP
jgi:anaerobic ribonucleoside-triphosphate reductase